MRCIGRCHFITLSARDYGHVIKEIERRQLNDQIAFFRSIPVFVKLSRTWLQNKMITYLKGNNLTVCRDQVLYKEGEKIERVYIIRQGEFEISK